ncbi:MAG: hypothetical protein HY355_07075 [Armatimonadetes bacterium]|nr:hypothetical protein [Armatimonadota bacterium]
MTMPQACPHLVAGRDRRAGLASSGRFRPPAQHPRARAAFWSDRRALGFKVMLLAVCIVVAALLEVPW